MSYTPDCDDCPTPAECKAKNDCQVMREIRHGHEGTSRGGFDTRPAKKAPRPLAQPVASERRKVARRVNPWGEPGKRKAIIDRRQQQPTAEALLRELVACADFRESKEGHSEDEWEIHDRRDLAAWDAARAFLRGGSGG